MLGEPHPTFELALRWLAANRPPSGRVAIVHGDFRLGNVIVGPDGLRAVVDWELVHLGDPMEDLGWLCVKAWRFGLPKPMAGVAEYAELFESYEAAGGERVDADVVRWWEVMGTLRWGMMCIAQAAAHLTGVSRSHELAAIGRRVCENEHDLFLALDGRW
jgi:aminoglycoside phosphotransferase (APT) family kinase protein